jgi:hypothetical protein
VSPKTTITITTSDVEEAKWYYHAFENLLSINRTQGEEGLKRHIANVMLQSMRYIEQGLIYESTQETTIQALNEILVNFYLALSLGDVELWNSPYTITNTPEPMKEFIRGIWDGTLTEANNWGRGFDD